MNAQPAAVPPRDDGPAFHRDRAFWWLVATQFLGAFNDNVFKQLVLLFCVDQVREGTVDTYQSTASALFAIPFVLCSGFAGYLSDRYTKHTMIVGCKVAEIAIMLVGVAAFGTGSIPALMAVLFLMGTHSAFFGPGKYGILPEILRSRDLPRANGVILMTTFLAIILGLLTAGAVKQWAGADVWKACLTCVLIAVVGTMTSLGIRRSPPAQPTLRFTWGSVFLDRATRAALWKQPDLLGVLLASSAFWLVAGMVYPPAINGYAKKQMELTDFQTGALSASTGLGITLGCLFAGMICKDRPQAWLVRAGSVGLCLCLGVLAIPGSLQGGTLLGPIGSCVALVGVGFSAGLFSVPLQVSVQLLAPHDLKGRLVAALNFVNWLAICASAACYLLGDAIRISLGWRHATLFAMAALIMIPIAAVYRLPRFPDEAAAVEAEPHHA